MAAKVRSNRGFASMDEAKQREIARKGGAAVSRNREHMSAIGRKGGEVVSQNREHMSAIGRRGGEARGDHAVGSSEEQR
ncbi:MAG: stress-induced protein [Chloroflexi bacterium]|nr:stress-induced protein [Chloroflexota bacterium]